MKNKQLTVKLLRDACKGLKANAPVTLKIKGQVNDNYYPISGVTFTAKSITLIVDEMNISMDDFADLAVAPDAY